MEQIAVISSPRLVRVDGGVDSIGGIPTFTKTMILIITFHGRFFLVLERKKRAPKKHQTHGWFYVMVRKSLLKIRVPWNKKPRYGTEPYMARLVSRGLLENQTWFSVLQHFLLGWKRSSFLPQNFKPNTFFPAREPWETLCSHQETTKCYPSRFLSRFHSSPAALQDMLVSTRLTPSQRWTLLESSKRSFVLFFFLAFFRVCFWNNGVLKIPQWQVRVSCHGDYSYYTSIYQRLYYYTIWIMIAAIWTSLSTRT